MGTCLSLFGLLDTRDWVAYDNRNLFLTVLEAGSLRSGCQHGQVTVLFQVADFSLCPHMAEGARDLLRSLL